MKLFKKLFCLHKWKLHSKKEYEWKERVVGSLYNETVSQTVEILICQECGKIKNIKY